MRRSVIALVIAAAVLGWGIWALRPTDEKIIQRRLGKLTELATFPANESAFRRAMHPNELREYFTEDVVVSFDVPGGSTQVIEGRGELIQIAALFRQRMRSATFHLLDITVASAPETQSATASMTMLVDINGEKNSISQELKMGFRKVDGFWLISQIETVKTLR